MSTFWETEYVRHWRDEPFVEQCDVIAQDAARLLFEYLCDGTLEDKTRHDCVCARLAVLERNCPLLLRVLDEDTCIDPSLLLDLAMDVCARAQDPLVFEALALHPRTLPRTLSRATRERLVGFMVVANAQWAQMDMVWWKFGRERADVSPECLLFGAITHARPQIVGGLLERADSGDLSFSPSWDTAAARERWQGLALGPYELHGTRPAAVWARDLDAVRVALQGFVDATHSGPPRGLAFAFVRCMVQYVIALCGE